MKYQIQIFLVIPEVTVLLFSNNPVMTVIRSAFLYWIRTWMSLSQLSCNLSYFLDLCDFCFFFLHGFLSLRSISVFWHTLGESALLGSYYTFLKQCSMRLFDAGAQKGRAPCVKMGCTVQGFVWKAVWWERVKEHLWKAGWSSVCPFNSSVWTVRAFSANKLK